jgi:hypothetical protein
MLCDKAFRATRLALKVVHFEQTQRTTRDRFPAFVELFRRGSWQFLRMTSTRNTRVMPRFV